MVLDLSRPEAYPEPHPQGVEVVTTHISWVFLTDRLVYKLKRPVHFDFCDFSTASKRKHDCEEELRVNAELARDIYLDVVPVYADPTGRHTFVASPDATVVDHAVRMRRLSDSDNLEQLLHANLLTPAHLEMLAMRMAAFLQHAPEDPQAGSAERVQALVLGNLDEVRRLPAESALPTAGVSAIESFSRDFLAANTALFEQRRRDGRIREGHGDLRMEHVYFPNHDPDELRVIDAIEFNKDFRTSDTGLEVAFLAMELDRASRPDFAAWFLSAFARASNDYGFYPLLDFFLCYRATVRAKIAALLAAAPGTPADRAEDKRKQARQLLQQAVGYSRGRPGPPAVICVGGMIGSGKSTVAETLSRSIGAVVVSSDHTRKHLACIPLGQAADPEIYGDAFTQRTLQVMLEHTRNVLASGRTAILDATFRSNAWRVASRILAEEFRARFLLVETRADESVLRQRLRTRELRPAGQQGVSDARESLLQHMLDTQEPTTEIPADQKMTVDTGHAVEDAVGPIVARLSALGVVMEPAPRSSPRLNSPLPPWGR